MKSAAHTAKELEKTKVDAINAILLKSTTLDEIEIALKTFMCDSKSYRNMLIEKYYSTLPPTIHEKLIAEAEDCFINAGLLNAEAELEQQKLIRQKYYISDAEKHIAESEKVEKLFNRSKSMREAGNRCVRDGHLLHKMSAGHQLSLEAGQFCAQHTRLNTELATLNQKLNNPETRDKIADEINAIKASIVAVEIKLQELNRKLDEIYPTDYSILFHSLHYAGSTSNRNDLGRIATQAIDTFCSNPKKTDQEKLLDKIIEFYQILNDAAATRERVVRHTNQTVLRSDIDNFLSTKREQPYQCSTILDGKKSQTPESTFIYLQNYYKRIRVLVNELILPLVIMLEKLPQSSVSNATFTSLFTPATHSSVVDNLVENLLSAAKKLAAEYAELEKIMPFERDEMIQKAAAVPSKSN